MTQPSQSLPPHAALLQMILGKWVSSAISAAAHFGIADHLESGPKSPQELAALTRTQERPLYRLLRANASVGVFTELEDGRFAQTPLSDPLRTNAKPCVRHMAMMLTDDWHIRAWEQLPWCVETGRPASYKLYGLGMFDCAASGEDRKFQSGHDGSVLGRCLGGRSELRFLALRARRRCRWRPWSAAGSHS
jgi:hypothetical protein